jgi:hypothetical protein
MNILIAILFHYSPSEFNRIELDFNLDRILYFNDCSDTINTTLTDHYHYMYIYIHPGYFTGQLLEIMDSTVYLKIMILCYTRCPIIQTPRYNNC